jgi:hypothetical protein
MNNNIRQGTILIENGTVLPKSMTIESEPYSSNWAALTSTRADLERGIEASGWMFFFLAGSMEVKVVAFDKQKAVHTAVDRLIGRAKLLDCNCLDIGEVKMSSLLGVPFASVSAHSRRIQEAQVFTGVPA